MSAADTRAEEVLAYMRQHGLPHAIEQALLRLVPARLSYPIEALNQTVWLREHPSSMQHRAQHLGKLVRWCRQRSPVASVHVPQAPEAGQCGGRTVPVVMSVDELIRIQTAFQQEQTAVNLITGSSARLGSEWAADQPSASNDILRVSELQRVAAAADADIFDVFRMVVDPFLQNSTTEPVDETAVALAALLFERHQLSRRLRFSEETLIGWLLGVYANHRAVADSPFFNFYQSLAVLQRCHVLVLARSRRSQPVPAEALFALFMAAISSGVHHPGLLSNDEVVSSMHPLASRYNDIAPIEQNAASVAFALATRSEQAAIGSADSLTALALEQTVLSFVCNNSASPQFQKQQRPGALYVGFRRRVLRLMTSPSGVALFPPLESAELEAIYVAACNGWCCSDGPGIQRWRDLLRLQAIRHCRSFEGHEAERVAAFQSRAEEAYAKSMADLHRRDSLIMSTRVA